MRIGLIWVCVLAGCAMSPAQVRHGVAIDEAGTSTAAAPCPQQAPMIIKESIECPACPACPVCQACPTPPEPLPCPEPEYTATAILSEVGLQMLIEQYRTAIRRCHL